HPRSTLFPYTTLFRSRTNSMTRRRTMKPYPYPHGPMPMLQGPMGAFPGQSPMMGPGMGQPIPQPFGMPYTDVPPQISFEQIQMEDRKSTRLNSSHVKS